MFRFFALPPADRRALLTAAAWLPLFTIGLRVLGLARFRSMLLKHREVRSPPMPSAEVQALARIVDIAARRSPIPAACLARSLLLQWMLSRRGTASQLQIGVRIEGGRFEAHAWLECDGAPVNDRPDVGLAFSRFTNAFPGTPSPTP